MSEDITKAQQTLRHLEEEQSKLSARSEQLSEERKRIGFAVFAENHKSARKKLDALNAEAVGLAGELESIGAAIVEAKARLDGVKIAEVRAADCAKAKEILTHVDAFDSEVHSLARAADVLVQSVNAVIKLHTKMNALGAQRPVRVQLDAVLSRAICSILMQANLHALCGSRWLAPDERRQFEDLLIYSSVIRDDAAARLGEKMEKKDAA